MDAVTDGGIYVDGENITAYSNAQLTTYRARKIGFVFQFYNLIPMLTALENVALMKEVTNNSISPEEALKMVGMWERQNQFPSQLSGGEQQRVSIARAVCKNPGILLCDEPTGALDTDTGVMVLTLLTDLCRKQNQTVVVVTHNNLLAEAADRVIRLKNGKIQDVEVHLEPKKISEVNW